MGEPANIHSWL